MATRILFPLVIGAFLIFGVVQHFLMIGIAEAVPGRMECKALAVTGLLLTALAGALSMFYAIARKRGVRKGGCVSTAFFVLFLLCRASLVVSVSLTICHVCSWLRAPPEPSLLPDLNQSQMRTLLGCAAELVIWLIVSAQLFGLFKARQQTV